MLETFLPKIRKVSRKTTKPDFNADLFLPNLYDKSCPLQKLSSKFSKTFQAVVIQCLFFWTDENPRKVNKESSKKLFDPFHSPKHTPYQDSTEVHYQTFTMEHFPKIVNVWKPITVFAKNLRCLTRFWIYICGIFFFRELPSDIYLFKVNNKNTRKRCDRSSELIIKTQKRRHGRTSFWCFYC